MPGHSQKVLRMLDELVEGLRRRLFWMLAYAAGVAAVVLILPPIALGFWSYFSWILFAIVMSVGAFLVYRWD